MLTTTGFKEFKLEDNHIEMVHNFNFLGSIICDDADYKKEIPRRLTMGRKTMTKLAKIMKDKDISVPQKRNGFIPLYSHPWGKSGRLC